MAAQPGLSYLHGADTSRVKERSITPVELYYVESGDLQGVRLDTAASYEMPVTWPESPVHVSEHLLCCR